MRKKHSVTVELFLYFFKIGFFTFGGGMSIVAQLQKDFVEGKKWLTSEELLDIVSVGRSIPGTMITNVACLFGHQMGGLVCGIASLIGMTLPSVIVLSLVTWFYEAFQSASVFSWIMTGVRAAVIPIIISASLKLGKGLFHAKVNYFIFAAAFLLSLINFSRPLIILLCGGFGLIYHSRKQVKEI